MLKRVISLILALTMVASLCTGLSITAFAAGETVTATVQGTYTKSETEQDVTIRLQPAGLTTAYCTFATNGITFPENSGFALKSYSTSNTAQAMTGGDYNTANGKLQYETSDAEDTIPADTYYDVVITVPANASGEYSITFKEVTIGSVYGTNCIFEEDVTATLTISEPAPCEHSYNNGACTKCGEACEHSWNAETGACGTCGTTCAHEKYENGACKVCGKAEPEAESPIKVVAGDVSVTVRAVPNNEGQNWFFASVSNTLLQISGTAEDPVTKVAEMADYSGGTAAVDGVVTINIGSFPDRKAEGLQDMIPADWIQSADNKIVALDIKTVSNSWGYGYIFVEVLDTCDHEGLWQDAGCTTPRTCTNCGTTEGVPAGHKLLGDGTCEHCDVPVPAISVTANGKPVEVAYTTASSGSAYAGVVYLEIYEDSDLQIVKKDAYTNNYTWSQIKAAYQTTTLQDGSPGWRTWPASYKLPLKSDVADLVNMPYFQIRNNSGGTTYDFIVIGVKSHPDHSYVNGECSICGKACAHSWTDGVCSTCGAECAHAEYENGACKVCGMAEPVVDLSLFNITVNGEAAPVYAGMNSKNKLRHGTTITGTSITLSTKNGAPITLVADGTANRITGEKYSVTNSSSSITLDLGSFSSTDLSSASYDTALNFPYGTDTTIYRLMVTVEGESSKQQIYVEVECDHEYWQEASCSNPKVCLGCGKFGSYPAHKLMGDGTCENCETTVPAIGVTSNGKPVDLFYSTASNNSAYTGVLYMEIYEGSDLQIVKKDAYTDNYTWSQIQRAYQTTEDRYGNPAWPQWVDSYKLPINTPVADMVNMPYFQRRTSNTAYDFYVIGVIAHPDHTFVDGECTICGLCQHLTWNEATCETPKTCAHCGKTEGTALGHDWSNKDGDCTRCDEVCTEHTYDENGTCTNCGMGEPIPENPITKVEVSHPGIETVIDPETGAEKLTMQIVSGTSEKLNLNITLESTELEPSQQLSWTSDKPDVAWVEDGILKTGSVTEPTTVTLTAIAVEKTALLALTDGEGPAALYTLEVTVNPVVAGYTVTMGEDVENTVIGSTVSVPVTIGHTDTAVTQYSAYDMSFTYDPAVLKLATFGTEITDVKDDNGNSTGTIHVEHYGDKTDNGTALTLIFEAIATGETNVKVTAAKVDISESALTKDAPDASIRDNITLVSVTGYTINLPADFEGKTSILPGETYVFEAKDKNYTYDFTGSTMGGEAVTVTELKDENGNGTGKFQIENVSGNIVIASDKTGKTFKVTMNGDGIAPAAGFTSGENAAQYTVDYKAQLAEIDNWNYSYTVTIGGKEYTDYTVKDGVITISGEDITGEITITVTRTAVTQDKHQVTIEGATGDVAGHAPEVENDQDYTFTVNKVVGYTYTVTATMDGQAVKVIDNGDGTYTIKNVTGVLKINVEKVYMMTVEVVEDYVKVEGKSMFLVLAETAVDTGKVLSYDGTPMFYTTKYSQQTDGEEAAGKWVYLVFTETTLSVEDAKAKITLADVSDSVIKVTLDKTFNVNESGITDGDSVGTVDINDAQLVYDMYNAVYKSFDNGATMQKFLKADVNGDKVVGVDDATAIVAEIISAK